MKNTRFEDLNIKAPFLKALTDEGYITPTPIQNETIPFVLQGLDVMGMAQTGTGKTAAFGLPIINLTDNHNKNIECVILCPTRELCIQISKDLSIFSKHMKYYKIISNKRASNSNKRFNQKLWEIHSP